MPIKILIVLAISVLCGVFYRLGGTSRGTLFRDLGSSASMVAAILVLFGVQGWKEIGGLFVSMGIMFGALTTYRYFLPKPKDYRFYHYALHGFFVALAILPWAIATGHIWGMAARCAVCAVLVGGWSHLIGWDVLEEFGRGFIMGASLLILAVPIWA